MNKHYQVYTSTEYLKPLHHILFFGIHEDNEHIEHQGNRQLADSTKTFINNILENRFNVDFAS